jgi:release factor glutamine methyltransferase
MTIGELLDALAEELASPGVPPSRTEARDLIAGVLDQPRFWPSAHRDDELDEATEAAVRAAAAKRAEGMPMQYAIGHTTFRHLTLAVDPRVLIPRPETEMLVDLVLAAQRGGKGRVVDVGTGCGAIALALASEGSFDEVHAIDLSADALKVARGNAEALPEEQRARLRFHEGSLLKPVQGTLFDTVVSNPPYIAMSERAELPALVPQAAEVLVAGGLLAMEVDSRRADLAVAAVRDDGRFTDIETRLDLTGRPRFVVARRQER